MRFVAVLFLAVPVFVYAQAGRGGRGGPAPTPRAMAPIDLTGYWVSLVTEDWRFRMVTPPKGDYSSLPLNAAGQKLADAWDPARDERDGAQCKSYGAPAIMRVPGRLHITWADDHTLKIETDAGEQTRLLHFGNWKGSGEATWQGESIASWDGLAQPGRGGEIPGPVGGQLRGSLKVVTTNIKPGYLRKNGVPYSANTVLTEYYDTFPESNGPESKGDVWLIVKTIVDDPTYLNQPFITSTHFKKIAGASGWNPTPCTSR